MLKPAISIVTPSYNMLPYLKLCHASIKDQGIAVEHVVMDGESTDGTRDWLSENIQIVSASEKDGGMYHALNKAIKRSSASIIGHLNCDEQYLPGVLPLVVKYFEDHPHVDFLTGNFLIVDPQQNLLAYRKSFKPRWPYFFSNYLYTTTCTLFYRREIFNICTFNESYRSIADVIFLYDVLKKGFKGVHIDKYFAVFTYSGHNLSLDPVSEREKKRFTKSLPLWFRIARPFIFASFFVKKLLHGNYFEKPRLSYSIFTLANQTERTEFVKRKPTFRIKFTRSAE